MPENSPCRDRRYDLLGWVLFVVSAAFFVASSIRAGDVVGLLAEAIRGNRAGIPASASGAAYPTR